MKREQKAFAMLMAACMAFSGIVSLTSVSAAGYSFDQPQLGNYIDDGDQTPAPNEVVLPSGRKVIKKTAAKVSENVPTEQQEPKVIKAQKAQVQQQEQPLKAAPKVIKAKKAQVQQQEQPQRTTLSMAAKG